MAVDVPAALEAINQAEGVDPDPLTCALNADRILQEDHVDEIQAEARLLQFTSWFTRTHCEGDAVTRHLSQRTLLQFVASK